MDILTKSFYAFILSAIITNLLRKSNILATPNERSAHTKPTPNIGGVAIILSTSVLGYIYIIPSLDQSVSISLILGIVILSIIGLLDDCSKKGLSYKLRLIIQLICSFLFTKAVGCIDLPIHIMPENIKFIIEFFFTTTTFMFLINASNFADGLNGLLSGCAMISCIFLAIMNQHIYVNSLSCMILAGGILGFFIFNFYFGKIFLGDVGSTFLGALIGIITINASFNYENPFYTWIVQIGTLSFILVDIAITIFYRLSRKLSIFTPHRDFLSHILNRGGLSHTKVTLIYITGTIISGSLAIIYHKNQISIQIWLTIMILMHSLKIITIYIFANRKNLL